MYLSRYAKGMLCHALCNIVRPCTSSVDFLLTRFVKGNNIIQSIMYRIDHCIQLLDPKSFEAI